MSACAPTADVRCSAADRPERANQRHRGAFLRSSSRRSAMASSGAAELRGYLTWRATRARLPPKGQARPRKTGVSLRLVTIRTYRLGARELIVDAYTEVVVSETERFRPSDKLGHSAMSAPVSALPESGHGWTIYALRRRELLRSRWRCSAPCSPA